MYVNIKFEVSTKFFVDCLNSHASIGEAHSIRYIGGRVPDRVESSQVKEIEELVVSTTLTDWTTSGYALFIKNEFNNDYSLYTIYYNIQYVIQKKLHM